MAHNVGIGQTTENMYSNEKTVYVECGTEILGYQVFSNISEPSEIETWIQHVLEDHKKHCVNLNPVQSYIKEQLEKYISEQPWWCWVCGEGGNYEGERPDDYWIPPKDHVCKLIGVDE